MAVPDSVPRPLVDNASVHTLQPVPQPVSPPECCSACRPAGCQHRKQSRWPYYHKSTVAAQMRSSSYSYSSPCSMQQTGL
ncbi:hypothetical protein CesoFtcFv8_023021 [Champsocephalus esox]|uniref:Uncharacterized protein n=1 Tax=Champsocephalus esox TaxID=159716 RepID=A0AAN8B800_9TELE|nr:hypothetical protein CesoFtcFv8_023021 [Champsocephalus esox]